jgi:CrcB protein
VPAFDPRELGAIFAGGCIGALARAGLAEAVAVEPGRWPWATFAVNVAGAALLGWLATRLEPSRRRAFLTTGFCGAITTFSTLQIELIGMLDAGRTGLAAGYAMASVAAGMAALTLTTKLGRRAC